MNSNQKGAKESYDTIGLDDDKINVQNISLNDNKNNFQSVSAPNETQQETTTGDKSKNQLKEENDQSNIIGKVKSFFNFGNQATENSAQNSSTTLNEQPSNEDPNSLKNKIMKKLQDNIEVEKSYQTFFILLLIGLALLCLSLMFLPVIILSPYKFVSCFSIGSLLILISFIFVYGTKSYFETLFSKSRFLFTLLFLGSIILGLVFAWSQYFFLSLICSFAQLVTLIVFVLSFIPGGKNGISLIGRMLSSPFTNMWMRMRGESYLPA
jgi:cation transport ATPase